MKLPDFIIVGAMKCATSTLHEQLARQPGIVMSEPKEPYFFSNDEVFEKGLDWYAGLFAEAGAGDLCGESSTHYTKLPTYPKTVERMRAHVPGAKLIYIMRHPLDRLISQYQHEWRMKFVTEPIEEAVRIHSILSDYSLYAMQLEPLLDTYGRANVLPVFFDRLHAEPQAELERVAAFIGYEGTPRWDFDMATQNVASESMKKNWLRDAIVFAPGVSALRRRLVPKSFRNRVKKFWQMRERPQLPEAEETRLRALFDADLKNLGSWLGVELTCANFKSETRDAVLEWI
jgi:hypothetical protein